MVADPATLAVSPYQCATMSALRNGFSSGTHIHADTQTPSSASRCERKIVDLQSVVGLLASNRDINFAIGSITDVM